MLVGIALVTVAAFLLGGVLAASGAVAPAVAAHVVFAVGIVPLILAAITHFVPVLTRTGTPAKGILWLPVAAQAAGVLAVLALYGSVPRGVLHAAAGIDLLAAAVLALWVRRRARACLGKPHPGWRWYLAALLALSLALASVLAMGGLPAFHGALRLLHLHLNTLGLVSLVAFGTLPVLLPTAVNRPDPGAAPWLSGRLRWFVAGTLLGSLAAACSATAAKGLVPVLGGAGVVCLMLPVLGLLRQWQQRFGVRGPLGDGAVASLVAASCGWLILAGSGVGHALGWWGGRSAIAMFIGGFLLPLVTGALTQLLPVWRYPGVATQARVEMRRRLAATGTWRAALFLVGGLCLAGGFEAAGMAVAGLALALFAVAVGGSLVRA